MVSFRMQRIKGNNTEYNNIYQTPKINTYYIFDILANVKVIRLLCWNTLPGIRI